MTTTPKVDDWTPEAKTRLLADVMAADPPELVADLAATVASINRTVTVEPDNTGNWCDGCDKQTFPRYLIDGGSKPRLFNVGIADGLNPLRLCLSCLEQLEDAANKAIGSAR